MKSKKLLIIILIVVAIIILGVGGFVLAYATTDLLKSDKQLFYKYLLESATKIEELESEELTNYFNKQKNTPYAEEGKLTVKAKIPEMEENYASVINNVNNLNITFTGKTDLANNKNEKKLQLNYSENVSFPLEFKQEGNLYGIKSSLVVKQYLAIRNENLNEVLKKLGIDSSEIEGILNTNKQSIDEAQITNVLNQIYKAIDARLKDANFSKLENVGYTLSLTEQEILDILVDTLTILQNTNIINQEQKASLESSISKLKSVQGSSAQIIKINVYKQGNISVILSENEGINIEVKDNSVSIYPLEDRNTYVTLQKSKTENEIVYNLEFSADNIEGANGKIYFESRYSGVGSNVASEKYKFGISVKYNDEEMSYEYNLNSNKTFGTSVDIEPMGEDIVILNDVDEEYMKKLIEVIGLRIVEINAQQMEELGIPQDQHPLIYATPIGYIVYSYMNNTMSMAQNAYNQMQSGEGETPNNLLNSMEGAAVQSFNSQFSAYEGIGSAANVKSLIQMVIVSNQSSDNKVSINGMTDKSELEAYMNQVSSGKTYTITINKDAITGYINKIDIN